MAGLWGGLGPRIIMIGTLTALQWFIYDAVKVRKLMLLHLLFLLLLSILLIILLYFYHYSASYFYHCYCYSQVQLRLPRPAAPEMPQSLKIKLGLAQE